MPTIGNALCVLAGCGFGGTGAAEAFFRIFEPEGFLMVGILSRGRRRDFCCCF